MRLHHVGIVVACEEEVALWGTLFGLREVCRDRVEAYDCECVFLCDGAGQRVELILAGPGGGPRKLRPGLHHVAFEVADVAAASAELAAKGMPPVEPAPVRGAAGILINFLSPVYTRGVRVELVQQPADWPSSPGGAGSQKAE
jgi:catechol 2,3-dioxygenase-like lactoylglutathione lyase family enzyme